jgi:hypothetical protein
MENTSGRDDDLRGGSGGEYLRGPTADTRLVEKAIRQRWPIPEDKRPIIAKTLSEIAANPKASHRNRAIAARILVSMDALNMEQERRDQAIPDHLVIHHRLAAEEMTTEELRLLTKLRRRAELANHDRRSE